MGGLLKVTVICFIPSFKRRVLALEPLFFWLQIMYLMALHEFMNGGPAEGDASYHGIASIHGGSQSYNGARPGGEG